MTLRSRLCTLLVACALGAGLAHAQPAAQSRDEPVSLNFANADIESVIKAIGKITGRNFLIDPRVKGTLNIVTNTPVSRDLTYQILLSALRLQGYTAVEGPGVIKIVPEADAKVHGVPVGKGRSPSQGDRMVTRVFTLQYESAAQMLPVVRPLVTPNNTVTAFPANNALVVTDYADNVERVARVIESIDVPQGGVMVLELKYAAAPDLAETISRLMGAGTAVGSAAGQAAGADASQWLQVVPDTRTNSLLVRADSPAKLTTVRKLVADLDRPGAGGNIRVVYLKNANAVQVAKTLNAVLNGEQVDLASPASAYAPANNGSFAGNGNSMSSSSSLSSSAATSRLNRSANTAPTKGAGSGIVQADPNSNAIIITAPEAIYNNLRHVIDQLDRRPVQVYVEALVAEITSERAAEIGIQWNAAKGNVLAGTNFGGVGQNLLDAMISPNSLGTGLNLLVDNGTITIPTANGDVKVANLGFLARFLEGDARANILSTPNLVTLDNEEARIVVGQNLPFVTGTYTTNTSSSLNNPFQTIERQDVGLTLRIRPQVTEGGVVRLEIYQEASSVVSGTSSAINGPTTNKRSIESVVLVDDGNIIALGGLVEDSYTGNVEKVPLLGDIPYIGNLFRYDNRRRTKTNLVVFLRPVILRDRDSYAGITNSRYDYVIGQQRTTAQIRDLMRGENLPPELPEFGTQAPAVPQSRAPVEDAVVIPVSGGSKQ